MCGMCIKNKNEHNGFTTAVYYLNIKKNEKKIGMKTN